MLLVTLQVGRPTATEGGFHVCAHAGKQSSGIPYRGPRTETGERTAVGGTTHLAVLYTSDRFVIDTLDRRPRDTRLERTRLYVFFSGQEILTMSGQVAGPIDANHAYLCNHHLPATPLAALHTVLVQSVAPHPARHGIVYGADPARLSVYAAWPEAGEPDPDFAFPLDRVPVDSETYLTHVALASFLQAHPSADDVLLEQLIEGLLGRVVGIAMDAALQDPARGAE